MGRFFSHAMCGGGEKGWTRRRGYGLEAGFLPFFCKSFPGCISFSPPPYPVTSTPPFLADRVKTGVMNITHDISRLFQNRQETGRLVIPGWCGAVFVKRPVKSRKDASLFILLLPHGVNG